MPEVKQERTGFRDQALSERHRKWGYNCPAVDIDFLLVEFDYSQPVALVEYKHERAAPQSPKHPSIIAIATLATHSRIPFFGVRYTDDLSSFLVVPLNPKAKEHLSHRATATEEQWVAFLYQLRGRVIPNDVLAKIREKRLT